MDTADLPVLDILSIREIQCGRFLCQHFVAAKNLHLFDPAPILHIDLTNNRDRRVASLDHRALFGGVNFDHFYW